MPPKPKPKPPPVTISGDSFYGNDELTRERLEELRYPSAQSAIEGLVRTWNGGLIGIISVTLSNDNSRIKECNFHLAGTLFGSAGKCYTSARFFEGPPLKLIVPDFDSSIFRFRNSLISEFIDSSALEFSLRETADDPPLTREEEVAKGISGFSLRAFIHPISIMHAKITVSLYPLPLGELQASFACATNPAFPGVNFFSAQFPLSPGQADAIADLSWGLPLVPAILSDLCMDETVDFPSTPDFRAAICTLLRNTALPDHKGNPKLLLEAWNRVKNEGEACLNSPPLTIVWPAPRAPMSAAGGRTVYSFSQPPPPLFSSPFQRTV